MARLARFGCGRNSKKSRNIKRLPMMRKRSDRSFCSEWAVRSLGPEVLAETFGKENFYILDSTVPAQIKTLENKLDLAKTLFIVASQKRFDARTEYVFSVFLRARFRNSRRGKCRKSFCCDHRSRFQNAENRRRKKFP